MSDLRPELQGNQAAETLKVVLRDALRRTWEDIPFVRAPETFERSGGWGRIVGDIWIAALRAAFKQEVASHNKNLEAIGGKRRPEELQTARPLPEEEKAVISRLGKWEFLYDVAVVELAETDAPYHRTGREATKVLYAKRTVWAVESEMKGDATEVAFDLSKLSLSRAENKVLIVRDVSRDPTKWSGFIHKILPDLDGSMFIGFMPSYSRERIVESEHWLRCEAAIKLYRYVTQDRAFEYLGEIQSPPSVVQGAAA